MAKKKPGGPAGAPPSPAVTHARARSSAAPAADPLPPTDPQAAAEWVPAADLHPWPDNPKQPTKGEIRGVADSIIRFGFGAALTARRASLELIAGHTRVLAVALLPKLWKAAGEAERATWSPDAVRLAQGADVRLPVRLLDIGEHDAHLLALADNELGAEWDPRLLLGQLEQLKAEERLLAGWTEEQFAKLKGDSPEHPADLGENGFAYESKFGVIVMAADEAEQEQVFGRLTELGYTCRVVCV